MAADLTSLTSVLKEYYVGPLAEQLNQDVMVTSILKTNSQDIEGLKAVVPLHYGRSAGISSRTEGGTIASAGNQKYTRAVYNLKYHYARVQVSGPSISNTRSDRGAFLQAMKSELDFIKLDIELDQARQYYCGADVPGTLTPGLGVIGVVATSGVTGSVVTLTDAQPIYKGFLYIGMSVDFIASPSTLHRTTTITDVNVATPSITVSTATSIADADQIVRAGNVTDITDITTNAEIDAGLARLVRDGTVGGIDPTTTGKSFWKGQKTSVTSTPDIALDDLLQQHNQLLNAGAKAKNLTMVTTPGLVRRLFNTVDFKDNVRFTDQKTLDGGFEEITFAAGNGPMRMNSDRLAPWGDVMAIDLETVQVYSPADWDFLSRDGLTVRWVTDIDAFQSILFRYVNLGTSRRNSSGVLTGYTDLGY